MPLNEDPQEIEWPTTHYIHVKKVGPFSQTAGECWGELHQNLQTVTEIFGQPQSFFSAYRLKPTMVYIAGVGVDGEQVNESVKSLLPPGMDYVHLDGGKYLQFTLTGGYDQLPMACGRVFELVNARGIKVDNLRYYLEHYVNNPKTTATEDLITHICIPILDISHE